MTTTTTTKNPSKPTKKRTLAVAEAELAAVSQQLSITHKEMLSYKILWEKAEFMAGKNLELYLVSINVTKAPELTIPSA